MNFIVHHAVRFICDKRRIVFYAYDPRQGSGQLDPRIRTCECWGDIPAPFRKRVLPWPWLNVMFHRMRRGKARLLCFSEDGLQLDAYGWIQDWSLFRRRYGAIATEGVMLGYYWTAPAARGRGLYGRLLSHSLALCRKDRPILIATTPDNTASQRGIVKAGFQSRGEWEVCSYFRWFSWMRRVANPGDGTGHGIS